MMSVNVNIAEIVTVLTLGSMLGGFLFTLMRMLRRFNVMENSARYRQGDMEMVFMCLRVLMEHGLGLYNGESRTKVRDALDELNAYLHTKSAGLPPRRLD